ncbi:MAG TPA: ATP-binding cassette domain-containing protein, partial [Solirubrobacterales bacterium]|nr:ATP-binding cassette domain-containing protein [Solirubrobacterales bacterium]
LDLTVRSGQITALLGPNGAGKTTTLLTLAGQLEPMGGAVTLEGQPAPKGLHRRAREGVSLVTEQRSVFMEMTVDENLRVGRCDIEAALGLFPELEPLLKRRAGLLSGGEQQMLTLARALAREPRVLLVDELSLGLAPLIVQRLLEATKAAAGESGVAVLLVEQHVDQALRFADYVLVMDGGRILLQGEAAEVAPRVKEIEAAYLANGAAAEAGGARN